MATDFGTFSPTCGGLAGAEWVRGAAARKIQIGMAPAWEFSVAGKAERRFLTAVFRFSVFVGLEVLLEAGDKLEDFRWAAHFGRNESESQSQGEFNTGA